ncbi:FtsH protease activity modulator HflK [Pseudahrensia aquimaris]|uniref:Protein HflK n=1 Tax=Pseudahrensia aquimaris TaxID=744461 RepID=A0ABW3FJC0_9HYPH
MPWSNQTGGGNNGSGGPTGGPWGQGPRGPQRPGGPGGGGNQPPDLEEIIRKGQERLRGALPGGGAGPGIGAAGFAVLGFVAVGAWLFASAYQVGPDELGVETRFGVPKDEVSSEGLHFAWWPIESAEKVQIVEKQVNIGAAGRGSNRQGLMLSGDQNILDVQFTIQYSIANAKDFLFNVAEPDAIVREVGESAMREVVGRRPAQDTFRDNRQGVGEEVRAIVQKTLDDYGAGIAIRALNIEDVAPPPKVADAFDEVQRAEQDEDKFQEEANRYRNRVLGAARGEAAQIREDAAAYKRRVVEEAKGEAQRFISVYDQYALAPEVTRKRLFLETMEKVLKAGNKVIVEGGGAGGQGGTGVVPYLPLPEINRQRQGASQ